MVLHWRNLELGSRAYCHEHAEMWLEERPTHIESTAPYVVDFEGDWDA